MKVLRIESPAKLKDGTSKAVIIVAKEDYIPLIMLGDRADNGEVLDLDIKGSQPEWQFEQMIPICQMVEDLCEKSFERGKEALKAEKCSVTDSH